MKSLVVIVVSISLLIIPSCKEVDELANIANVPSQQCGGALTGVEGLYWDICSGFPRGDIPNGPPTIANPGGTYFHPGFPLLGFIYPVGWTPQTLSDPLSQTVGVNLFRNDNNAIYRFVSTVASGFISVNDVFNFELSGMMATFGLTGAPNFVCTKSAVDNSTGLLISAQGAFVRVSGFSSIISVNTTQVPGLSSTFISVEVTAAPTSDYAGEILNTFLPIGWQMLYSPNDTSFLDDRDGDGVPDVYDDFPDDPTRS